jgi:glycerol uptake facilitator-like aquaporin
MEPPMTATIHDLNAHVNPKLPLCLVEIASVYGNQVVRPIGIVAQTFAEIAGTKTLTAATLRSIQKLGYRVVIESGGAGPGYDFLNKLVG